MKNKRLMRLRKNNKLTQCELAKTVGLSQSMISCIEAGKKDPGKKYKICIAKLFNVSVDWLFYELYDDLQLLDHQQEGLPCD